MAAQGFSIAIIGAGIGGLAAAAALRLVGVEVRIYEQARAFARIGAGIQQAPNSIRVLRRLGLEGKLNEIAFRPYSALNRKSDTGEVTWERMLGADAEKSYGAPYFLLHRGDLHEALASVVSNDIIARSCYCHHHCWSHNYKDVDRYATPEYEFSKCPRQAPTFAKHCKIHVLEKR